MTAPITDSDNRTPSAARRGLARVLLWLAVIAAFGVTLWQTEQVSRRLVLTGLAETSGHTLDLHVANLRGELEKYQTLPQVLARDRRLVYALLGADDPEVIASINRHLEAVNRMTGAADTYLMDRDGLTIAASNWRSEKTFIGGNFSFRPYFQEAMAGRLGRYFALGTTSIKRGYYFAYPVMRGDERLGAVVVKVDMANLEDAWRGARNEVLVTDPDGVIFVTSNPDWRYRALAPLSPESLERLRGSRRYVGAALTPMPVVAEGGFEDIARLVTLRRRVAGQTPDQGPGRVQNIGYLVQERQMPEAGWTVHLLTDLAPAKRQIWASVVIAAFLFAIVVLSAVFLAQRRRNLQQRMAYEKQVQDTLKRARDELEVRVGDRTHDLRLANERLQEEIAERRRAESELIQAGKLAVLGRMSAGISHELNQPLAAIRSYADNAAVLIDRQRTGEARSNLTLISGLVGRMAEIIDQFKIFARSDAGEAESVPIRSVIDSAVSMLESATALSDVEIEVRIPDGGVHVLGDRVRLEQVLVNLLSNAQDALVDTSMPRIEVVVTRLPSAVELRVSDNGAGIPDEHLGQIFEPFFTTKEVGKGLGMGLALVYGIVKDLGGTITAGNRAGGGAEFVVTLRPAETATEAA